MSLSSYHFSDRPVPGGPRPDYPSHRSAETDRAWVELNRFDDWAGNKGQWQGGGEAAHTGRVPIDERARQAHLAEVAEKSRIVEKLKRSLSPDDDSDDVADDWLTLKRQDYLP